jgi:hypothetical protein
MQEPRKFTFDDFQRDFITYKQLEQDLKTALYAIHPIGEEGEEPTHYIVLFADLVAGDVEYSICDQNMMELRLIAQVPKSVMMKAAALYEQVVQWSKGEAEYPHSNYVPNLGVDAPELPEEETLKENLDDRESSAREVIEQFTNGKT